MLNNLENFQLSSTHKLFQGEYINRCLNVTEESILRKKCDYFVFNLLFLLDLFRKDWTCSILKKKVIVCNGLCR